MEQDNFYKQNPDDTIWWHYDPNEEGRLEFSFDRKTIFNAWQDYPWKLTVEQKTIFDKENPFWADFFRGRE